VFWWRQEADKKQGINFTWPYARVLVAYFLRPSMSCYIVLYSLQVDLCVQVFCCARVSQQRYGCFLNRHLSISSFSVNFYWQL